jgi:hypothetical protein
MRCAPQGSYAPQKLRSLCQVFGYDAVRTQLYSFTHLALALDDFTQASMKALPATPSAMPG